MNTNKKSIGRKCLEVCSALLIFIPSLTMARPPCMPHYQFNNPFYVDMEMLDWATMKYIKQNKIHYVESISEIDSFGGKTITQYYYNEGYKLDSIRTLIDEEGRKDVIVKHIFFYDEKLRLVKSEETYWAEHYKRKRRNYVVEERRITSFRYNNDGEIQARSREYWGASDGKLTMGLKDSLHLIGHNNGYAVYRSSEASNVIEDDEYSYYIKDGFLLKVGTRVTYDSLDVQDRGSDYTIEYFTVNERDTTPMRINFYDKYWQLQRGLIFWSQNKAQYQTAVVDNFVKFDGSLMYESSKYNSCDPGKTVVYQRTGLRLDERIETNRLLNLNSETGAYTQEVRTNKTTFSYYPTPPG